MSNLLHEIFGLVEITPISQANRELGSARSVFAPADRGSRTASKGTAQAQADVDSAKSVRKEEPGAPTPPGLRISGDKETLGALMDALQEAEHASEPDLSSWCHSAVQALAQGIRRGGGSVSLPRFEQVPAELEPEEDIEGAGEDY